MAYATAEHLRLFLRHGLAFTAEETAQAELLIELAEGAIDDELGQSLELSTDTVTLDGPTRGDRWPDAPGTGSRRLLLPRWPVTAVTSVTILGDDAADEVLEHGADHDYTWSESGILTRVGGWWPTGDQRIQVVYTAGHATIPKGVKRATLRLAAAAWGNPELLSSETLGDHSRSWSADALGMTLSQADITALGVYRART
ncbi:hypothetical protein BJP40_00675 [Streptomyces sp. CC53]|uniref:hypothetical protein n=1 Tax=Streptomyces sp. CC53 TaxID=1906740 RepID=UPI0008DD4DB7|nr:hypothetical protein [Streptomyces sp. CC53]OII60109.1 hypothetical protein BJP40_00675 [Streptomyces sp. CC53]